MISVRVKLVLLVLASFAPAVVGAVVSRRAAEQEILTEASAHIAAVGTRFDEALDEYEKNARLALTFATQNTWFQRSLAEHEPERVQRFVDQLGSVYKHRTIIAADANGAIIAKANSQQAPKTLSAESSPAFTELLAAQPLVGLIPIEFESGAGYTLINATPVLQEGQQVGALALLSPISQRYLEYLKRKLSADLALHINGQLLAATDGHPAANLRSAKEEVVLKEEGSRLFAVETFHPTALARPGLDVALTASREVTDLRAHVRAELRRHLLILGAVGVLVLSLALWFASRIGRAIAGVAAAAAQVKAGNYASAPVLHTRDELERLSEHFNEMVQGLKERDRLKETFGRYVTRQIADHLMKGEQQLGGELVPVTILFSDIRSFTSISESMPPRDLLDFLNEYFSGMVESVLEHNGVVDKFIGDAIMAVFGAPVPEPDDALHAVRAALDMRARLKAINVGFRSRGLPEIRAGIGLHTGQVVAGNMGHQKRMEYTVIGDAVNLASRLEGLTKELACDVILSEDLLEKVQAFVTAEPLRKIKVKGREQEVMVYRLIGLREEPRSL